MRLWFYGQFGSTPNIYPLYDPLVQKRITRDIITGSYASQRGNMTATLPRISATLKTEQGTLVVLKLFTAIDTPTFESFILRREGSRWRIVHDTFLERALVSYVQDRDRDATKRKTPPSARVVEAKRIARHYRNLLNP